MTITNITLAQLRVLATIAEEASFSAAAERIGMTQSGASQAMRALEGVLGVTLLARLKEGVVPTEIGQAVLADAREAILAIERIQQRCAEASGLRAGRLRIGSIASAAARLLPQKLARYRSLHPGIQVSLLEGSDREVLQWVEEKIVDLGLTSEASPETEGRPVHEDEFLLVVPAGHALAGRGSVRLEEIAGEDFLMSGSGCEPAISRLFAAAGLAPKISLTVRDTQALGRMVAQGLGVTLMPELSVPESEPGLARAALEPPARRQILAVTRRRDPPLPAAVKFAELLSGRG